MTSTGSKRAISTEAGAEPTAVSTTSRIRQGAFALVAVAALALAAVMMNRELVLAFTGWTQDLGIHQVHDMTIFGMLWIAYVGPVALLLYRPVRRVNAVIAPLVFLVPIAVFATLVNSPILMLPVIFGALALVVLALHPAGRDVFRFDRVEHVNRVAGGLLVAAAVPLLVYAGMELITQLTVADEHSIVTHYGGMAVASVYVVLMGALAVTRERDWRFAAWSAGLLAAVVGSASILFTAESSLGVVGGGLLVLFGVAFVAVVELGRLSSNEPTPEPETVA